MVETQGEHEMVTLAVLAVVVVFGVRELLVGVMEGGPGHRDWLLECCELEL